MPIHDWAHAPSGLFHHFHQAWSLEICNTLNEGLMPPAYYALVEQRASGLEPDVLTLTTHSLPPPPDDAGPSGRGTGVMATRPTTRFTAEADPDPYASRANRIVIRSTGDDLVTVIEIVSPGNKVSRSALRSFVEKLAELLRRGVNLLIVDLLPPSPRDPHGIHKVIWDEFQEESFDLPPDKPLTLAAYAAGVPIRAFVEAVAIGDSLPDMPLFLAPAAWVPLPLERTYEATWTRCPQPFKRAVLGSQR